MAWVGDRADNRVDDTLYKTWQEEYFIARNSFFEIGN